jgi:electron transport complex protein RnfC
MDRPIRKLWRFHGGLRLTHHKTLSNGSPIRQAALPKRLILPLRQHIGTPAQPLVKAGDEVLKGQMIASPQGPVSAPIHAPTSGRIIEIAPHRVPHPSGGLAPCITIEPDGLETWAELPPPIDNFLGQDPKELVRRIRDAGIVGLGGAAFPASIKLNPGIHLPIHTLILNGAECEPFITCDDRLMREQSSKIITGLSILRHILGAKQCLIGIEDNKPEAIAAMDKALTNAGTTQTEVVTIPSLYPTGGEKQLIQVLTGREVPSHGLPAQLGIVCHNVGTAAAVADAILHGRPLISRVVTVTGQGVARPGNFETLIGTPASELIAQAGGYTGKASRLILGGPMMGITLRSDDIPLVKGANCVLVASAAEVPDPGPALPCIRCGECARVCPVSLLPQQLYWHARARDLEKTQDYRLFDCIECGCCSHVCPSHIPLVQYFRFSKQESWAKEKAQQKSEHARQRHEARVARLERMEQERQAKLAEKKAALEKKKSTTSDPKKAAIEAAMRRVAEKKAAQQAIPKNLENLTPAQQKQIEEAEARRAAKDD